MSASLLNYRIDGSGPPVVLLHPVGLDLTFFDSLVAELSAHCQLLRIDMRGHGKSPVLPGRPGLQDYANDVHVLLQELCYAPAAIVGFSFGGMIAQVLTLEYPGDVAALVASACPGTLPSSSRKVLADRGSLAEREGMAAVLETTLARWFSASFRGSGRDAAARLRLLSDDIRGWGQAWRAISEIDTAPRLASIAVPTLCLAGGADLSAPPEVVRAIAREIRNAQFVVVPDAPHMLFIEQPKAVAAAILGFLAGIVQFREIGKP